MIYKNDFEILFLDKADFDDLFVQIRFKNLVLCDLGVFDDSKCIGVDVLCNDVIYNNLNIRFPLDDFLGALNLAREQLISISLSHSKVQSPTPDLPE